MRTLLLGLLLLPLSACGLRLYQIPPEKRPIVTTHLYDASFEDLWSTAVAWFAEHNVKLEKIEKTSGFLSAVQPHLASDPAVDVGKIEASGSLYGRIHVEKSAEINMLIRGRDDGFTQLTVNVFGHYVATAWQGLLQANYSVQLSGHGVSTGLIEESVFEYCDKKLPAHKR